MGRYCASGDSMEFYYNMSLCTLDILFRCAFSFDEDIQTRGWVNYTVNSYLAVKGTLDIPGSPIESKWGSRKYTG